MMLFAIIGGVVGAFVGLMLVRTLSFGQSWYRTKRECRECLRTRVEYGFHVDGKEYKCVEKEGAEK